MGADNGASSRAASAARKRKRADCATNASLNSSDTGSQPATPSKKARVPKPTATPTEKRLRRFRPNPPKSFQEIYNRATTQRFYVLSRTRSSSCGTPNNDDDNDDDSCPEETVELTGSTGNIYTVTIAAQPRCDCPHARVGNQCKHVLYVLARVLRARFEHVYQLALLRSELREIFAGAPPPLMLTTGDDGDDAGTGAGKRKPVEGDCPICFCEMEVTVVGAGGGGEPVVWCRAACGQNVHKGCFETWAATKRRQAAGGGGSAEVTCPYCRSVWEGDEDMVKLIQKDGKRNAEGYVNVASQLGISAQRDYSTYSSWWSGHPDSYRRQYY
ncbi:E3 ubiquitin-protein ligase Zswim2 [Chaetomidium leptoderma]|uniref:E3 ubiquitin-protein ligase Zswim2 n=1 Tax=Chaetomidium leptoderma TaxID=669021 RepID=A0AAN6ZW73_9PEZI|nr:E3 ubiquitin-protein ligase Zswim2 [Chaetomidium leptoderma]